MKTRKSTLAIALALGLAMMLIPAAASGQTADVAPIYQAITDAGVHVDDLRVIPVEGIVIVRGKVHDEENFNRVAEVLKTLGYLRVANLLKITPPPNDMEIRRAAERELGVNRSMEGARLRIESNNGVVTINGTVLYELQRDAAINIVRGVDGVREVHSTLEKI